MSILEFLSDYSVAIVLVGLVGAFILGMVVHIFHSIAERTRKREEEALWEKEEARQKMERRQHQQKDAREHRAALPKYQEVVKNIADLKPSCLAAWDQVMRMTEAIRGSR